MYQYVYVGDTGGKSSKLRCGRKLTFIFAHVRRLLLELDQEAGETMLREYPEIVKAVFLHVVSDTLHPPPMVPPPKLINGRPLVFFRTYVGAAVDAVQLGFMDVAGLESVIGAATSSLADTPPTSSKWADISRDVARAEIILNDRTES